MMGPKTDEKRFRRIEIEVIKLHRTQLFLSDRNKSPKCPPIDHLTYAKFKSERRRINTAKDLPTGLTSDVL